MSILIRALVVAGVAAIAAGCDELFGNNNPTSAPSNTDVFIPPRPRTPIRECGQISGTRDEYPVPRPVRELSIFRAQTNGQTIMDRIDAHQVEINAGNFGPISRDSALRASLLLLDGFSYYVGEDRLVNNESDVENLKEVYSFLAFTLETQNASRVSLRGFTLFNYGDQINHRNIITTNNKGRFADFFRCWEASGSRQNIDFKISGWN